MLIARNLFRGKLKGFQKGQFCSKITVYNLWSTGESSSDGKLSESKRTKKQWEAEERHAEAKKGDCRTCRIFRNEPNRMVPNRSIL